MRKRLCHVGWPPSPAHILNQIYRFVGIPYDSVRAENALEEDEEPATADAECLKQFLERKVLSWYVTRKKELANRPLIREQAFGEAFDPDKLERLGRYEVHLDRKLERTLTMMIRLQDLRRGSDED